MLKQSKAGIEGPSIEGTTLHNRQRPGGRDDITESPKRMRADHDVTGGSVQSGLVIAGCTYLWMLFFFFFFLTEVWVAKQEVYVLQVLGGELRRQCLLVGTGDG